VYAEQWRVWSDAPVGERYESTPYWAFRRWPAQVVGVVTAQNATGPVVVTQWSDGEIVAIDARRGVIAWRDTAPIAPNRIYDGRRTGAATVYEPTTLLTARSADRLVILVTGPGSMNAYDAATGQGLWRRDLPTACEPDSWTGAGMVVVPDCGKLTVHFYDVVSGEERGSWTSPNPAIPPAPGLCELNRTECRLVLVRFQTWLLGADSNLTGVPSLEKNAQLAGERVIYQTGTGVAARRLTDVAPLWTWYGRGQLISADSAGVYLLTDDRTVLELSPATGHLVAIGCASSAPNEDWKLGHIYPTGTGTYLALERITKSPVTADDQEYFYGPRPVALVELYTPTKLPVWPGKFAACAPV
jgi:outer membrane protein assembly factor BamB